MKFIDHHCRIVEIYKPNNTQYAVGARINNSVQHEKLTAPRMTWSMAYRDLRAFARLHGLKEAPSYVA